MNIKNLSIYLAVVLFLVGCGSSSEYNLSVSLKSGEPEFVAAEGAHIVVKISDTCTADGPSEELQKIDKPITELPVNISFDLDEGIEVGGGTLGCTASVSAIIHNHEGEDSPSAVVSGDYISTVATYIIEGESNVAIDVEYVD